MRRSVPVVENGRLAFPIEQDRRHARSGMLGREGFARLGDGVGDDRHPERSPQLAWREGATAGGGHEVGAGQRREVTVAEVSSGLGKEIEKRAGCAAGTCRGWRRADAGGPRSLYDLILQLDPSSNWSIALETYRGSQDRDATPDADWDATAVWVRWTGGRHGLTLRAEKFDDERGGISGTAHELESYTATWVYQAHESAKLFFELRRDESTADFFPTDDSRQQDLALVALAFAF